MKARNATPQRKPDPMPTSTPRFPAHEQRPDDAVALVGVGLREAHVADVLRDKPALGWFEVLADNYLSPGGPALHGLEMVRRDYPLALHCVGMSLGSVGPLDYDYLASVRRLAGRFEALWISDHLCFTSVGAAPMHDLLPLPFTEEAVECVALKIREAQDFLGQRILIENVSSYLTYRHSTMDEMDFLAAVVARADCDVLLDLNNWHVNVRNHGWRVSDVFERLPLERVREVHLGGFQDCGDFLLDAHDHPVSDPVWRLFETFVARRRDVPVLIEWDNALPAFGTLLGEADKARRIIAAASHPSPALNARSDRTPAAQGLRVDNAAGGVV